MTKQTDDAYEMAERASYARTSRTHTWFLFPGCCGWWLGLPFFQPAAPRHSHAQAAFDALTHVASTADRG